MKTITVSDELLKILPEFTVAAVSFKARVQEDDRIAGIISGLENTIGSIYDLDGVLTIPNIKAARDSYKALGKDPSRYRLAVESLFRRIVKGNHLYRINNLVDLGNILSLQTMHSVAVLDADKIQGDIFIRIGTDEEYEGINRGKLNIENIPVYCDSLGPFGTPTSDSLRTMITENTENILVFIIIFNNRGTMQREMELCEHLYREYARGSDFSWQIIP